MERKNGLSPDAGKGTKSLKTLKNVFLAALIAASGILCSTRYGFRVQALSTPELDAAAASVHFIDVGQGAAALIRCGESSALVDTGTDSSKEELVSYLRTAGVTTLDLVVLTHPHNDHTGGYEEVLRAFDVRLTLLPSSWQNESADHRSVEAFSLARSVKFERARGGAQYSLGAGVLTVLYTGVQGADANDRCTVVRFDGGGLSCLFGADAQQEELEAILDAGARVEAQVYAVAHHGSNDSSVPAFLRRVRAQYAVISCGRDNMFGHPGGDALYDLENAGSQVLRTDESGSVAVWADTDGTLHIVTQKEAAA